MPIDPPNSLPTKAKPLIGITLVLLGVLWINLNGQVWGWIFVAVGCLALYLTASIHFRRTPLEWSLAILFIFSTLSLFITANPELTRSHLLRLYANGFLLYGIIFWAVSVWRWHLISAALVIFGTVLALVAPLIVDWNLNKGGFVPEFIYQYLPQPILSNSVHPNIMATILIMLSPLALAYFLLGLRLRQRNIGLLSFLSLVIMANVLLLTKSRGGYIALAFSWLFVIWWSGRRKLAFMISLATLALLGIFLTKMPQTEFVADVTNSGTLAFRLEVWQTAINMLRDFAFTGVGMGEFNDVAYRLYPLFPSDQPGTHNLFLQVGVDLGMIGLIAFTAVAMLTLFMGWSSIQKYRESNDKVIWAIAIGLTAGFIGLLIHGLVDNTIWATRVSFLIWVYIGFITAIHITSLAKD